MRTYQFILSFLVGICLACQLPAQIPVEIVVHRGANHLAPENTVASAMAALDQGATWIEVDVRRSKDGVLFNLHDETLDRTTNGKGPLSGMLSGEVETLDAGSWFGKEFTGTRIPRIAEMLDSLKGKAHVFFDVKRGTPVADLITLVREKGFEKESFFWFADQEMQDSFISLAPEMRLKVNASDIVGLQEWMKVCRPSVVETAPEKITPEFRRFCHEHDIKIMAAVMEASEEAYREAIVRQADLINLDRPELFQKVLREYLSEKNRRIAFISDAHIQDVAAHPKLVRSMEVQVQSTRLFNENYFALIAALDDVAGRGISLVVLPGDLTDDGQLVNQEAVKRILDGYSTRYGMSFFVTTGNHDAQRPFGRKSMGKDFLTPSGQTTTLASCASYEGKDGIEVDTTLRSAGYQEEMACYAGFGYFPQSGYLYWETPFSSYTYDTYNYRQAMAESGTERRCYTLCDSLAATDASYLVEPVEGLWLLAIDGGVYLPAGLKDGKQTYQGAGAGYNNVLKHKVFLLPWVRRVAAEARKRNKALVTFCHYPLADFNDDASARIASAWGKDKFDLYRVPDDSITEAFLDAGIRLHVAGHMHVNDTGVKQGKNGKHLYNIQVPSIATCVPAYKILTVEDAQHVKVETVTLDSVPGFDSLFPLYEKEYAYTMSKGRKPVWSKEALRSKDYIEFCDWQFRDLVRVRFIPGDLPALLKDSLLAMNGAQLLAYVSPDKGIQPDSSLVRWTGADLILDLYRLRYAGRLAEKKLPEERINQYQALFEEIRRRSASSEFRAQLKELADIFGCFLYDEPCVNFSIDLEKDRITEE